jgi:hypothetical protein
MDTIERPISEFTKKCLWKWWGKVGNSGVKVLPMVVKVLTMVVKVLTNTGLSRCTKYTTLCDFSVNFQIPQ